MLVVEGVVLGVEVGIAGGVGALASEDGALVGVGGAMDRGA